MNNQIKKEVLDYLSSATACVNTEILQWSGLIGITDWYKELFADTQIAQSVLAEFCQNPYRLERADFIKVFQDRWAIYPPGYILESDGTLVAKISTGEEMVLYYCSPCFSNGSTSSEEGLVRVGNIRDLTSPNFSDTAIKLSKGLHIYNLTMGLYHNTTSSTMQGAGDCGTFELVSKLAMGSQSAIACIADSKLRKDLEKNQYLFIGFEGFLEFSVAKGLTTEFEADDIHRIIRNSGARLDTNDWYKWHKKDALNQTWLRLYKQIKRE